MLTGEMPGRLMPNPLHAPRLEPCQRCIQARRDLHDALAAMLTARRAKASLSGWTGFLVLAAENAEGALREGRKLTLEEATNLKGAIAFARKALE